MSDTNKMSHVKLLSVITCREKLLDRERVIALYKGLPHLHHVRSCLYPSFETNRWHIKFIKDGQEINHSQVSKSLLLV